MAYHAGVERREASVLAEVLVWSDMIGRPEQGVWRLPIYLKRFKLGLISSPSKPRTVARKKAVMLLDAQNGFGQFVGQLAMGQAIRLAEKFGVGVVGVKRGNHFGPCGILRQSSSRKGIFRTSL